MSRIYLVSSIFPSKRTHFFSGFFAVMIYMYFVQVIYRDPYVVETACLTPEMTQNGRKDVVYFLKKYIMQNSEIYLVERIQNGMFLHEIKQIVKINQTPSNTSLQSFSIL